MPHHTQALTDAELSRLSEYLREANPRGAMGIEELDGLLCALVCGPEEVPISEYLPHVFGRQSERGSNFRSIKEAEAFLALLTKHSNTIALTLLRGEIYEPFILKDENGIAMGNDWATGFERGILMRDAQWSKLINHPEYWDILVPFMLLAHEHEPAPKMFSKPLTPEERKQLVKHMASCVTAIYGFFRREAKAGQKKQPDAMQH